VILIFKEVGDSKSHRRGARSFWAKVFMIHYIFDNMDNSFENSSHPKHVNPDRNIGIALSRLENIIGKQV
jgi:hypothetical protein